MTERGWPARADLGPGRVLRLLTSADAVWAGPALAALDPWRRLGSTADGLSRYLQRVDPALHRYVVEPMANASATAGDADDAGAGDRRGAVERGEATGRLAVLCLRDPWLRGPFVELLAVFFPGQGHGRAVVDWVAARAGVNLWSTVSAFNSDARAFYARCGFVEVACLPGLIRPDCDDLLLRRQEQ